MATSLVAVRRFVIGLTAVIGLAGLYVGQNTQALGLSGIVPAVDEASTTELSRVAKSSLLWTGCHFHSDSHFDIRDYPHRRRNFHG